MKLVVCDTGPLLHLSEVGCLELLHLAGRVCVPAAVADEMGPTWEMGKPQWVTIQVLEPRFAGIAASWAAPFALR